jgi:hypothetical protein
MQSAVSVVLQRLPPEREGGGRVAGRVELIADPVPDALIVPHNPEWVTPEPAPASGRGTGNDPSEHGREDDSPAIFAMS